MNTSTIGILCGFEAEARIARKLSPLVACSGAIEAKAQERVENLIRQGATSLLSFGVSGGLDAAMSPQDIVIPDQVKACHYRAWNCDPAFSSWLRQGTPAAKSGCVFGSKALIPSPEQKKELYRLSGCIIVDMESQVVAEAAARHKLPFAVLRGVSDGIEDTFPQAALVGINEDGGTNNLAVIKSLLLNPFQFPALKRLFHNTGTALGKLDEVISRLREASGARHAA